MKALIFKRSSLVSALLRFNNSSDKNTETKSQQSWFNIDEKDSSLLVDYKHNKKSSQRLSINYFAGPHGAFLPFAK